MYKTRWSSLKVKPQVMKTRHTTTKKAPARQKEKQVRGRAATAVLALQCLTPAHLPEGESVWIIEDCCKVSRQGLGTDCGGEHTWQGAHRGELHFQHIPTLAHLGQGHISGPEDVQQGDTASKHNTD